MFYIIGGIVSLIIAAIPVVITIKNEDDLIDNIFYFIVVFLSSIAFAVFLGFDIWFFAVSKKDSTEFYLNSLNHKEQIEEYYNFINLDNYDSVKQYINSAQSYNRVVKEKQNNIKVYGNLFSRYDKRVLDLEIIEIDKNKLPINTLKIIKEQKWQE